MGEKSKWKMAPQNIISAVTSKTKDGNLTNSRSNIFTSEPQIRQLSKYYAGLSKVFDMSYLDNRNVVSLCTADFPYLMNPNVFKKDRYIGIVSNMIELPVKGIFSANQVCAAGLFYDDKTRKCIGGGSMATTDGR